MERILVSIVTPVYRGEGYLEELVAQIAAVRHRLENSGGPVELAEAILVDDAAVDGSSAVIAKLEQSHPWLRSIHLSRNFGQHSATIAGILHSSGDWVVTLDEDLQHPPDLLVTLLTTAIRGQLDIVYGKPKGPVHSSWFRNFSSRFYKGFVGRLAGNRFVRDFNSFRIVRGDIARAAAAVCSYNSYFDIVLTWYTSRIGFLEVSLRDLRAQAAGSSYTLARLIGHARRLLVSSEIGLLRLGTLLGATAVLASLGLGIGVLSIRLFAPYLIEIPGWTSLTLIALFFGGLLALLNGVLLEYVGSLVLRSHGKPTYFAVDRDKDRLLVPFLELLEDDDPSS